MTTQKAGEGMSEWKRVVIGDAGGNAWRGDWRDAADDCEMGMADLKDLNEVVVTVDKKDIHLNPAHITSIHWETRPAIVKPSGQRTSGIGSRYAHDPRSATFHRAVIDACVERDDLPKFSTRLAIVDAILALIDSEDEARSKRSLSEVAGEYLAVKREGAVEEPKPDLSQKVAEGLAPWIRGFRGES